MGRHASAIWLNYFEVFNENSFKQRKAFFSDPIIQFLWSRFIKNIATKFTEYLMQISGKDMDESKR